MRKIVPFVPESGVFGPCEMLSVEFTNSLCAEEKATKTPMELLKVFRKCF